VLVAVLVNGGQGLSQSTVDILLATPVFFSLAWLLATLGLTRPFRVVRFAPQGWLVYGLVGAAIAESILVLMFYGLVYAVGDEQITWLLLVLKMVLCLRLLSSWCMGSWLPVVETLSTDDLQALAVPRFMLAPLIQIQALLVGAAGLMLLAVSVFEAWGDLLPGWLDLVSVGVVVLVFVAWVTSILLGLGLVSLYLDVKRRSTA